MGHKKIEHRWLKTGIAALIRATLISLLLLASASAGTSGTYAVMQDDKAVETLLNQNRIPSGYRFYYAGRAHLPYAVIGIRSEYTLNGGFWHEIGSAAQLIEKVGHLMPIGAADVTYARIIDGSRGQVGLWVSEYRNTVIEFESDNTLTVFSPYQPNDNV